MKSKWRITDWDILCDNCCNLALSTGGNYWVKSKYCPHCGAEMENYDRNFYYEEEEKCE